MHSAAVSSISVPAHRLSETILTDLNDYQIPEWPSTPEGEARQADELERHYRSLVSHPAVEAITYWGVTDAGAWLGVTGFSGEYELRAGTASTRFAISSDKQQTHIIHPSRS